MNDNSLDRWQHEARANKVNTLSSANSYDREPSGLNPRKEKTWEEANYLNLMS